jgi:hypothetical protein
MDAKQEQYKHLQTLLAKQRKLFSHSVCLHPDASNQNCSTPITRAHTIQRANILESIAKNGHVAQFRANESGNPKRPLYSVEQIGINEATTFSGFCNRHDSQTFGPIDSNEIELSGEQTFLFAYRPLCREVHAKMAAEKLYQYSKEYAETHKDSFAAEFLNGCLVGTTHGLAALLHHKKVFDDCLARRAFDEMRLFAVQFDQPSCFFCSSGFSPEFTFDSRLIQDLNDLSFIQDNLTLTVWNINQLATVIFAWHSSSDKSCIPLVKSLEASPKKRWANLCLSLAFEHCENVVFSDDWWCSLSSRNQNKLGRRVASGGTAVERKPNCLADDGHTSLDWTVCNVIKRGEW